MYTSIATSPPVKQQNVIKKQFSANYLQMVQKSTNVNLMHDRSHRQTKASAFCWDGQSVRRWREDAESKCPQCAKDKTDQTEYL